MKQAVKLIGPGELLLHDLGYFVQDSMIDLAERGAYFLSRFNHRTSLYTQNKSVYQEDRRDTGEVPDRERIEEVLQTRYEFLRV